MDLLPKPIEPQKLCTVEMGEREQTHVSNLVQGRHSVKCQCTWMPGCHRMPLSQVSAPATTATEMKPKVMVKDIVPLNGPEF